MSTLLRLATAGSVDDGKSTLVGRLLHDSKSVLVDQLDAVERVSRDRGLDTADLALLTDGLRAEREQGITTITASMAAVATGTDNVAGASNTFQSAFFLGFILFVLTLSLNLVADRFVRRVRQKY